MARSIWKFTLNPDQLNISMPIGAKVLTAREQDDTVCVWAEVDTDAGMEIRRFSVYGTGHEMPDDPGSYVGTAMMFGGGLVFHVYEPS